MRPCRHHGVHRAGDGFLDADVEGGNLGAAAVLGDLGGDPVQLFFGAPGEDDGGAERRQFVGDAAADAAAAAGDPMHLAGEQAGAQHAGVGEKGASSSGGELLMRGSPAWPASMAAILAIGAVNVNRCA
jgi:hypothetical protein